MGLALRRITAGYGSTIVLRGVDLEVRQGGVTALLGPNGAGKTTLLRVASGLLPVVAGALVYDGQDVTGRKAHGLTHLGICHITEGRSIFDHLSVRDNLRMFAPAGGESEAIERALSAFPALADRLKQIAGTLSGGQQQMLALSRAYMRPWKVILLDEVSLGLAPVVIDEIFAFLSMLKSQGTSLLLVEQYVARALAIADHAYVVTKGAVVYDGPAASLEREEVFQRYVGQG